MIFDSLLLKIADNESPEVLALRRDLAQRDLVRVKSVAVSGGGLGRMEKEKTAVDVRADVESGVEARPSLVSWVRGWFYFSCFSWSINLVDCQSQFDF